MLHDNKKIKIMKAKLVKENLNEWFNYENEDIVNEPPVNSQWIEDVITSIISHFGFFGGFNEEGILRKELKERIHNDQELLNLLYSGNDENMSPEDMAAILYPKMEEKGLIDYRELFNGKDEEDEEDIEESGITGMHL